ncbi:MAG: class I SAM-dependent methyltransferase [Eubacteriales bacterium]|nr:class I SAM-dependent methyltransferase [Eubacteriales bacterium]
MCNQYDILVEFYDDISGHDPQQWAAYLAGLLRKCGVQPGSRVADVACGTGSVTMELCKAGYDMTGMDISLPMLTRAADKAARQGLPITYVRSDMTQLRLHNNMQAVVCACDGVNYVLCDEGLLAFFRSCRRGLKPGGVLLFDISSAYKLENMNGQFFGEEFDDLAYLWTNRYDRDTAVLTMDLTFFIKQGELFRRECETHRQRAWTKEQIVSLLERAGFAGYDVYEGLTEVAPQPDAQRLQFIAYLPDA